MEPKFQTSFIPKKSLSEPAKNSAAVKSVDLLFLVALIVFLATIAAGAGVFLYAKYVKASIENKSKELERSRNAFNPELIEEVSRLSRRLDVADSLLDKHISVSAVLEAIEGLTLKSVRFNDFSQRTTGNSIMIEMRGEAKSFGSIALQSDKFGESKYIANPVFSNLNLDSKGNVTFLFSATVDPALVSYKSELEKQQ